MDWLSLSEVADMTGGALTGSGSRTVRRISKDTRTLVPGDLYLALRGEAHDGNLYARAAIEKGAAAAILDRPDAAGDLPQDFPVIIVPDALAALHRMASAWRDRLAIKVACITGSSGKTSTKEFTAAVLSVRYRVTKTEGNLNNHIGLPLSILAASSADDAAVWELGMNHAGEIAPLADLARPDLGIITNIGVAHIEYLGSREGIAAEKGALLAALGPNASAVLPNEDDFADYLATRTKARVIRAGLEGGQVMATNISMDVDGCRFTICADGEFLPAYLPAPGVHMVKNALLAAATGLEFGLSLEECVEGLATARLTGGRLTRKTIREVTVLDDTYNANPDSMKAALATLAALPGKGKRVAVLGRMGELGEHAEEGYRTVGTTAANTVQTLIAVGPETAPLKEAARSGGMSDLHTVDSPEEAAALLKQILGPGDIVLVKGSRAARMERVIQSFEN